MNHNNAAMSILTALMVNVIEHYVLNMSSLSGPTPLGGRGGHGPLPFAKQVVLKLQ